MICKHTGTGYCFDLRCTIGAMCEVEATRKLTLMPSSEAGAAFAAKRPALVSAADVMGIYAGCDGQAEDVRGESGDTPLVSAESARGHKDRESFPISFFSMLELAKSLERRLTAMTAERDAIKYQAGELATAFRANVLRLSQKPVTHEEIYAQIAAINANITAKGKP